MSQNPVHQYTVYITAQHLKIPTISLHIIDYILQWNDGIVSNTFFFYSILLYTTFQEFGIKFFLRSPMLTEAAIISSKMQLNSNIVKYYYNQNVKTFLFLFIFI